MPNGYSLHIGVGHYDSAHYGGNNGRLEGAHSDALLMRKIAAANGFTAGQLLSPTPSEIGTGAYSHKLLATLGRLADKTVSGDMVLLTFSGHGGQVPDTDDLDISEGKYDETWCLYDRQVLDDEIYRALARFKPGVRILIISDSCHSGTVSKALPAFTQDGQPKVKPLIPKALPHAIAIKTFFDNRALYQEIRHDTRAARPALQASVIQISACQDAEETWDGTPNSVFTGILEKVWGSGSFSGNYRDFHQRLQAQAAAHGIRPNLFLPSGKPETAFLAQRPFKIG